MEDVRPRRRRGLFRSRVLLRTEALPEAKGTHRNYPGERGRLSGSFLDRPENDG